jgi:predicted HicB family RNase H-like nuclease
MVQTVQMSRKSFDGVLNVRGLDRDLVRKAKAAAATEGITIREWVAKAIKTALTRRGMDG